MRASLVENLDWLRQNDQLPGIKCLHHHNGNANPGLEVRDNTNQIYRISSESKCFQSRFLCEVDRTVIAEVVDVGSSCRPISLANQHKLSTWESWQIFSLRQH